MFKALNILINGVDVTPNSDGYNYKAMIETMLSKTELVRDHDLFIEGWVADKAYMHNDMDLTDGVYNNPALATRARFFANSAVTEKPPVFKWKKRKGYGTFIARVICDVDKLNTGIPPGCGLTFIFKPCSPEWYLMVGNKTSVDLKPQFEFVDTKLYIMHRDMQQDTFTKFMSEWEKKPMVQNIIQRRLIPIVVNPGRATIPLEDCFQGLGFPSRFIMVLVSDKSYNGSYKENPYYFGRQFGDGPDAPSLVQTSLSIDGNHVDNLYVDSDNAYLQAQMEFRRFQIYTGQDNRDNFTAGVNFWSTIGRGVSFFLTI
jgi:hypothetical protein